MRISDWSSDVCSSDLYGFRDYRGGGRSSARETAMRVAAGTIARKYLGERLGIKLYGGVEQIGPIRAERFDWEIGRASCRERVCQYVSISVVAVSLKKKKKK